MNLLQNYKLLLKMLYSFLFQIIRAFASKIPAYSCPVAYADRPWWRCVTGAIAGLCTSLDCQYSVYNTNASKNVHGQQKSSLNF